MALTRMNRASITDAVIATADLVDGSGTAAKIAAAVVTSAKLDSIITLSSPWFLRSSR